MTLTDAEVRAIDEAARVLRRVARTADFYGCGFFVRQDGRVQIEPSSKRYGIVHADLEPGGPHPTPGEALRRLVGR